MSYFTNTNIDNQFKNNNTKPYIKYLVIGIIIVAILAGVTAIFINRNKIFNNGNLLTKEVEIENLYFLHPQYTIENGSTIDILVNVEPSNANTNNIICESSDESIATASFNNSMCSIKSIQNGTVTITARSTYDIYGQTEVSVIDGDISVKKISFPKNSLTIKVNSSENVALNIYPNNATDKSILCSSSNTNVVTVTYDDNVCKLTAVGIGDAVITAMSISGYKSATLLVKVIPLTVDVTNISFAKNSYEIEINKSVTAAVSILPNNATYKNISCASSNTNVATVSVGNNTCNIRGIGVGNATITAISSNGSKKATTTVKVFKPVVKVNFSVGTWNVGRGCKIRGITGEKLGSYIKSTGVDIIGLQEARWYNGDLTNFVETIRKTADMSSVIYANTAAGNAVVSKFSLSNVVILI